MIGKHILVVADSRPTDAPFGPMHRDDWLDAVALVIECPTGTCGWTECREEHIIPAPCTNCPGLAECGSTGTCEDPDPDSGDTMVFHGIEHEYRCGYRYGYGWMVPFGRCVVDSNIRWDPSTAVEIAEVHGPGRWLVDDEWIDDCDVTLLFAGTAPEVAA